MNRTQQRAAAVAVMDHLKLGAGREGGGGRGREEAPLAFRSPHFQFPK